MIGSTTTVVRYEDNILCRVTFQTQRYGASLACAKCTAATLKRFLRNQQRLTVGGLAPLRPLITSVGAVFAWAHGSGPK
jgi:hypothetical protein